MAEDDLTAQMLVKLKPADAKRFGVLAEGVGDKKGALARKVLLQWMDRVAAGEASPGGVTIASPSPHAPRTPGPQPTERTGGSRASWSASRGTGNSSG